MDRNVVVQIWVTESNSKWLPISARLAKMTETLNNISSKFWSSKRIWISHPASSKEKTSNKKALRAKASLKLRFSHRDQQA